MALTPLLIGFAVKRQILIRSTIASRYIQFDTMKKASITIGIRREDKNRWECRSPLTPEQVSAILSSKLVKSVIVQPSGRRVFTDAEFTRVGAQLNENLGACDIIMGVKEMPIDQISRDKTYLCFSHTHKGQPKGMSLLETVIKHDATLIDYELMTNKDTGKRLVAFGKFAGYAGLINCLHGIGDRLLHLGYRTPFVTVGLAHQYCSLEEAERTIQVVGQQIRENHSIPEHLQPMIFLFTGTGNVSKGAQHIFQLLPHRFVRPDELEQLVTGPKEAWMSNTLIGCVIETQDYCVNKDRDQLPFSMGDYISHPETFKSVFNERFARWASVLVNGIYWESPMPRLLERGDCLNTTRLISIADITCDIDGSIEFTNKATTIDKPFYIYNPKTDAFSEDLASEGIQMMTIDNLPTQLPKDASEYFGVCLLPILQEMLQHPADSVASRATIVHRGALIPPHSHLTTEISKHTQKTVLVLGSGYVSGPVLEHLSGIEGIFTIVASNSLEDANARAKGLPNVRPAQVDVSNPAELSKLVNESDLVVSLVPATMHMLVAQQCLVLGKHLVTASYTSSAMANLHQEVRNKGLLFLNEIGLDPGLDHLSALNIFDEIKSNGDQIDSFTSWCGGLPAPECADNPLGYKFSWSPRGVLLATQNEARYKQDGHTIIVPGSKLLESAKPIAAISPAFAFEGLPNRDSLHYIDMYGLHDIGTMMRGTLRYQGFSKLMARFSQMGFLSLEPLPARLRNVTDWFSAIEALLHGKTSREALADHLRLPSDSSELDEFIKAAEWLGIFSKSEPFLNTADTFLDAFCELLQRKMQYVPGERDMTVMQHEIGVRTASGSKHATGPKIVSTFVEFGQPNGHSAMARTVGLPVAVAAELILKGEIKDRGVYAPLHPSIYRPLFSRLRSLGIIFKEHTIASTATSVNTTFMPS